MYQLHGYQQRASDFIVDNPRAFLMLQCGLGKTLTTLHALNTLMFDMFEINRILVVCPNRVGAVWRDEVKKWGFRFSVAMAYGKLEERKLAFYANADITVISRDNLRWAYEQKLLKGFDVIVADERFVKRFAKYF